MNTDIMTIKEVATWLRTMNRHAPLGSGLSTHQRVLKINSDPIVP
jgi:hypothetical protein